MRSTLARIAVLAVLGLSFAAPRVCAQATAEQYYQAGLRLYASQDYAQAVKYFGAAVQVDPNHVGALRGAGNCYLGMNQSAQALPYYEKALGLSPDDAQLAQFVSDLKAQVGSAAGSPPSTGSGQMAGSPQAASAAGNAYAQGKALFDQKQYAAAQPYFAQAVAENPMDGNAYFYLGYCQYAAGDRKGAALNFARSNQANPNATAQSYALRIRSALTPEEQAWVDAELARGLAVKPAAAPATIKEASFGIRLLPGIAMYTLGDLKTDSDNATTRTRDLQEADPSIGLDGNIPSGGPALALEAFVPLGNSFEMGMHFESLGAGTYEYTITNSQEDTLEYTESLDAKVSAMPLGLCARVLMGAAQSKLRPFVGLSALYVLSGIDYTYTAVHGGSSIPELGAYDYSQTGTLKANAMGVGAMLGLDFAFTPSIKVSPFVSYRMLKAKGYTGTVTDSNGDSYDAELRITNGSGGQPAGQLWAVPTSNPADAGFPDDINDYTDPAEVDLGGLVGGLALGFYF